MRIGGVRVHRDDWWVVGDKAVRRVTLPHKLLDVVFRYRPTLSHSPADFRKGVVDQLADLLRGKLVRFILLLRPRRFKLSYQVCGRCELCATGLNEFDRSRID